MTRTAAALGAAPLEEPKPRAVEIAPAPSRTQSTILQQATPGGRFLALDAFRGFAIAAMILVNAPGSANHRYAVLNHSEWNGWTPADLIFPAFLFIVGVALTLAVGAAERAGASRRQILGRVFRRAALIFALGLFLNAFPNFDWSHLRIPGVLQRIAASYLLGAIVLLTLSARGQAATAVALLVVHSLLLRLVPFPGHGAGTLLPDANLGSYLDHMLLRGHLLHDGWDPEGLLGTIPSTATTLMGALAGHFWLSRRSLSQRVGAIATAGVVAALAGLALGAILPINKSLWTSSFVLFAGGVSLLLLAAFAWLIELRGARRFAVPLIVYGSNPLLAYLLSILLEKELLWRTVAVGDAASTTVKEWIYSGVFLRVASGAHASLLYSLAVVLMWFVPLWALHRRRIFLRL